MDIHSNKDKSNSDGSSNIAMRSVAETVLSSLEKRFGIMFPPDHPAFMRYSEDTLTDLRDDVVSDWAKSFEDACIPIDIILKTSKKFIDNGIEFPTVNAFIVAAQLLSVGSFSGVLPQSEHDIEAGELAKTMLSTHGDNAMDLLLQAAAILNEHSYRKLKTVSPEFRDEEFSSRARMFNERIRLRGIDWFLKS